MQQQLSDIGYAEALFDMLPDVVFFVKDAEGRYIAVNRTLALRCGLRDKARLIGRTAADIFPGALGAGYLAQDVAVIRSGAAIDSQFELHLYPDRRAGWCLTRKVPIRDATGAVVALAGISRDLGLPDVAHPEYRLVAGIAERIRRDHAAAVSLARLAKGAGLSMATLERCFRRVFGITPRQMLLQSRLDAARALLVAEPARSISDIAHACGYTDHSAFSRQFKAATGMTPAGYRQVAG